MSAVDDRPELVIIRVALNNRPCSRLLTIDKLTGGRLSPELAVTQRSFKLIVSDYIIKMIRRIAFITADILNTISKTLLKVLETLVKLI